MPGRALRRPGPLGHTPPVATGRLERRIRRRLTRRHVKPTADREPPATPPGWQIGPPDFVGVGTQRAGTTWWFAELRRHPQLAIAPGSRKELHFFDPFANRPLTEADIARYHQWFPRPDGSVTGEWTPVYVYEPWAISMVARAAPDAVYLLLLRDPLDRFGSGLEFGLGRGFSYNESVLDAFHRGLYAGQVARLFEHVPRERVLVQLYEELRADPSGQRRRSAQFLGLDPERFPNAVDAREPTKRASAGVGTTAALMSELRARYCDDLGRLAQLLPELDFGRWSTLHA